jgi:hypothetical protein
MIEFLALDGKLRTAEVWSNGPVARSVWALADGKAVAIQLVRQDRYGLMHREIVFTPVHPDAIVTKRDDLGRVKHVSNRPYYIAEHVTAPRLAEKTWRELTADQRAPMQLALV